MSEQIQISQETNERFLTALHTNDLQAVTALVAEFGTEVYLTLKTQEQHDEGEETYLVEIHGTPLPMAAWLEKESIAMSLVHLGAVPASYGYAREGSFGWDACSVMTMERALTSGMLELVRALMDGPHLIDWSDFNYVDQDDWGAARPGPTQFESIRTRPDLLSMFETIGIFRGLIAADTIATVRAEPHGGFVVTVNEESLGTYSGMPAALEAIWNFAGLIATPDPYDPFGDIESMLLDEAAALAPVFLVPQPLSDEIRF